MRDLQRQVSSFLGAQPSAQTSPNPLSESSTANPSSQVLNMTPDPAPIFTAAVNADSQGVSQLSSHILHIENSLEPKIQELAVQTIFLLRGAAEGALGCLQIIGKTRCWHDALQTGISIIVTAQHKPTQVTIYSE